MHQKRSRREHSLRIHEQLNLEIYRCTGREWTFILFTEMVFWFCQFVYLFQDFTIDFLVFCVLLLTFIVATFFFLISFFSIVCILACAPWAPMRSLALFVAILHRAAALAFLKWMPTGLWCVARRTTNGGRRGRCCCGCSCYWFTFSFIQCLHSIL